MLCSTKTIHNSRGVECTCEGRGGGSDGESYEREGGRVVLVDARCDQRVFGVLFGLNDMCEVPSGGNEGQQSHYLTSYRYDNC